MMKGEQYRASLRDGRTVYVDGKRVGDVETHSHFDAAVGEIAECYDRFFRPEPGAVNAYMDPPRSVEALRAHTKRDVDLLSSLSYTSLMTLMTAAHRLADVRPQAREAILTYVDEILRKDIRITECITDAKGDRSRPPAKQDDADAYLRVVDRRKDGVVIRGAKLHISMAALGHELMVIPTKAMKADEGQYAIACGVAVNAPGVKIVSVGGGAPPADRDPRDFPFSSRKAAPQGFVIFDDVFVPHERIFLDGETQVAALFAHSLGLWIRASELAHMADEADTLVGFAQLIAEANGLERIGHIKDKIADMAIHATLVRAAFEASIANSEITQDGVIVPHETYTNAGKYQGAACYSLMVRHLLDIAGGSVITAPSIRDLENAEIGPLVRKYMGTKQSVDGTYRLKLFHAIKDLTVSAYGGHRAVSILQSGGGLYAQQVVTRGRYDMERAKELALRAADLDPVS